MISSITEFPANTVKIIAISDDGDVVAVKEDTGRYYAGEVDGDVFINAFNVRFTTGRDDARAVAYFEETYGFEFTE